MCTIERSFSTLRQLNVYLKSTTSDTTMNGLALSIIYRNNTPFSEQIINRLSETSNRRLNMNFQLLDNVCVLYCSLLYVLSYHSYKKCASLVAIARYITIIYTIGYLQIFKVGYFFSRKHCHFL